MTGTELPLKLFARGKVRDTYELGPDQLLMVATDRISAFDHILPNGIPDRGKVLTQLSIFWFSQTDTFQPNHLISGMVPDLPPALKGYREELAGRFMIVRKAKRIDFECVVRGYLAGSAWKEYQESQSLAGEKMPPGLRESERLASPIFSPATKAESGHDENITFDQMKKDLGDELATKLRDASMELYKYASEFAGKRGLILADTKFEFGTVGDVPGRRVAGVLRQAVRARLVGALRLGQGIGPATTARRRGHADAPEVPGGVPAPGRQAAFPAQAEERNMIARVIVTPKPVVNDPQGITVKQGLASLGFREVVDVRVGKYIEVSLEGSSEHEARQRVEAMCRQLLANHVIEDFRFDIEPEHKRR